MQTNGVFNTDDMQQINNGFDERYYLTESGKVFNAERNKYIKKKGLNSYTMKTVEGEFKTVSLKSLYALVYGKNFCIDTIESLPNEKWEPIYGTDEMYWVSNKGRVKSLKGVKAKLLKPYNNGKGYYRVDILKDNERYTLQVHRLVADAFLIGAKNHDMNFVHHIDKDTSNNRVENLIWVSELRHKEIHKKMKEQENQ